MPRLVWYRSLYWRIALGFVALVATLLAAQGTVFLWLTGRMSEFLPGRSPQEYSQTIATDVSATLQEKPDVDLDDYLNSHYTGTYRAFVVVTRDRSVVSRRIPPPPMTTQAAYRRLYGGEFASNPAGERPATAAPTPASSPGPAVVAPGGTGASVGAGSSGAGANPGAPPRNPSASAGADSSATSGGSAAAGNGPPNSNPDRGGDGRTRNGRGGDGGRGGRGFGRGRGGPGGGPGGPGGSGQLVFAPIVINDETIGVVAVPSDAPPLMAAVRNLGPTLGIVAVSLLVAGTALAALLIYWPTRRRLKSLQTAAQSIGAGQSGARAIESGRDEVAMLARAFNEMAEGLEERTQALVSAHESRRQLLADVSHELMTPLSAIRGYVETMTMPDLQLDPPTRQRYLGIVFDETERLEHIIGDLLDLARMEGGGGTWRSEPVPVAALFERVQHRHDPLLQNRHVRLEAHIAADASTVTGDPNRLEQALQNLAANAVRHTPEGGRVTLTADRAADGLRLVVEDTGPGIPEEHLPHVFDRFYKVDESRTGTKVPSGSGLGLSIVQAIVNRHGGRITAGNTEAGGARFEIVLPA
jgi:signal transduction histidine kinase